MPDNDLLLLRALKPPPDPHVAGWRRVGPVHEADWDGQRWVAARVMPGAVEAPPWWAAGALLGVAIALGLFVSVLAALLAGLYLLPALIACLRPTDWWKFNAGSVSLVGIVAGWTMIGWVAALVMAVMKDRPPA